jgi:hypothetical protein
MIYRILIVVVAMLAACKGKPERRAAPNNAQTLSVGSGSDKVLHLPGGDGSPPKPTHGPLSQAALARVRGLEFPGFNKEIKGKDTSVVVVLRTGDRPRIKVTTQIRPCDGACVPLDLAKWKARTDLFDQMSDQQRAAKDTKMEVGATSLFATPMIYTFQYGLLKAPEGTRYTDAYVLWFNDGTNEIRVISAYADDLPTSVEAMLAMTPEEDLEKVSKAFMDVFTQAWAD